jgi:hypothetical protein
VNRYALDLLRRIEEGQIDPSYIITHRAKLEDGPALYETLRDKKDGCIKVVLTPYERQIPSGYVMPDEPSNGREPDFSEEDLPREKLGSVAFPASGVRRK